MSGVTIFGLDSTSEVSPAAHHAIGSKFAIRYLSRYSWKLVKRQELVDASRNGLWLGVVYEDGANDLARGYAEGKALAEFARKQSADLLGVPSSPHAIIPFAVDADVLWSTVRDGFEGIASVLGRDVTGPYGSYGVCGGAHEAGFQGLYQTYAWSGGRFLPASKWYQYSNDHTVGGVGTDFDKAFDLTSFWNGPKPTVTDPHHYAWFYEGPFKWGSFRHMNERAIAMRYDALRATQTRKGHPHRPELATLRAQCKALADRIAYAAMAGIQPAWGPPNHWNEFHRRERYAGLIARWQGKRVV